MRKDLKKIFRDDNLQQKSQQVMQPIDKMRLKDVNTEATDN